MNALTWFDLDDGGGVLEVHEDVLGLGLELRVWMISDGYVRAAWRLDDGRVLGHVEIAEA
jgi:hypothetical protein